MLRLIAITFLLFATTAHAQWREVSTGVTASLRGLAVHGHFIWASGSGGTWLRSRDDGKTWTHGVVPGAEAQDFRGVAVLDDKTVLLMSSGPAEKNQAHIYCTTDAGAHWTEVFHGTTPGMFLDAIKFWDAKHGIVFSDPVNGKFAILLTDDGGKSWREAPSDPMPAALPKEGAFAASNSALAVYGKSDAWFGTGGAGHGRVFHSSDRGATWTVSDTPVAADTPASGIFSMAFSDGQHGVAVGGDYQKPNDSSNNIAYTTDGGRSWRLSDRIVGPDGTRSFFLSSVAYTDAARFFFAAGTAGAARSSDGRSWIAQSSNPTGINAVAFSATAVWLAGAHGAVWQRVGLNWIEVSKEVPQPGFSDISRQAQ